MTETSRIIEAVKFVLRDSKGRRRAELGTQNDDNPELVLLNDQEQPQARFAIKFGSASVELLNSRGVRRATIEAGIEIGDSAGSPSVTLYDSEGRNAISLSVIDVIKSAGLTIYGAFNEPRLSLGGVLLEGEFGFALGISDENGASRIRMRVTDAGGPTASFDIMDGQNYARVILAEGGFYLQDEAGNSRVKIAITEMGPAVAVVDASGQPRGVLSSSEKTGIAHLMLLDPQGTVRFDVGVHPDGECLIRRKRWWWPF